MKKATITFITSAALAFAIPLYAADEPGMKSDSQQKAGLTQQQTGKMQSGQMITADKLEGMTVVSQEGKEILNLINYFFRLDTSVQWVVKEGRIASISATISIQVGYLMSASGALHG